jgi:hypothetical protein
VEKWPGVAQIALALAFLGAAMALLVSMIRIQHRVRRPEEAALLCTPSFWVRFGLMFSPLVVAAV